MLHDVDCVPGIYLVYTVAVVYGTADDGYTGVAADIVCTLYTSVACCTFGVGRVDWLSIYHQRH